jgi:hypothetical protein
MHTDAEQHALRFVELLVEARHAFWMSIAAATADTAEPNSANMASPAVPTSGRDGIDGRPPDLDLGRLQVPEGAGLAPSIMRVKPAMSAWTMAARRRCMFDQRPLKSGVRRSRSAANLRGGLRKWRTHACFDGWLGYRVQPGQTAR